MKNVLIFSLILTVSFTFGLQKSDVKSMSDYDRIYLSISYYEVALKYKELNKEDLYNSYMSEALKLEKNVSKYFKGELEVPAKAITFSWDDIFEESETDEPAAQPESKDDTVKTDNSSDSTENVKADTDIQGNLVLSTDILKNAEFLISAIKTGNIDDIIACFSEKLYLEGSSIFITRDELKETVSGWLGEKSHTIPDCNFKKIDSDYVELTFDSDPQLFIPAVSNVIRFKFEKNDKVRLINELAGSNQ